MHHSDLLQKLAQRVRQLILVGTTEAGSGHPSSSLSAVELMVGLLFSGTFRYDIQNPANPNNDRLIFSKGHASPLLYALWAVAGALQDEEIKTLRKFGSRLEGHPSMEFPYTEVVTGSLGQGLSIGLGMALNAQYLDKLPYKTYVLLGDSEMSEGSNWEAIQLAIYYKLNNLVGIIDVNRLGQRGETIFGHDLGAYERRIQAFGWSTYIVDGHNFEEILNAYAYAQAQDAPTMIIARTLKGKGVSILEDKDDWHGKALSHEQLEEALQELGSVDVTAQGEISMPEHIEPHKNDPVPKVELDTSYNEPYATRKAYGHALVEMYSKHPNLVILDAELSNSTFSETFKKHYPDRFFEMFIAEQNMVGVALGLSLRGKIPFISTFGAFFTRAYDQIRVAQLSQTPIHCVGSHVGVSMGQDGPTQMGLEDIALFRTIQNSVILYPADHVSCEKLAEQMIHHSGITYMRTTRMETEQLYSPDEEFHIGGSKTLKSSDNDEVTLIGAGVTLYQALTAYEQMKEKGISVRVIDLYSVKPLDMEALTEAARQTKAFIVVEDHYAEGGIGEAVMSALSGHFENHHVPVHSLAVRKKPRSGQPHELLDYEEISAPHIVEKIMEILNQKHA